MSNNNTETRQRIVIIGAGFGGLNLAKKLKKDKFEVHIVDRNNYHSFPPLFYQVASSGLEPASISFALRREMLSRRFRGCVSHFGDVTLIDLKRKEVKTQFETIPFDKLVIAAGTTNNFFNIPDLEKRVYTLKSTAEAIRTRNSIIERMERAALTKDPVLRRRLLTFAVVGGGPTGVEIAGALGEMKRFSVPREYPEINRNEISVRLIEGSDRLLRTMSQRSSDEAYNALRTLMVDIELNKTMKSYENGVITFTDGSEIQSDTVIWTAGVTGVKFNITGAEVPMVPGNRFEVDEFNRVKGFDDLFAIGDISCCMDAEYPRGCPQLAQPAIQQGRTLAKNLNAGEMIKPFKYNDKGSMATIGRNRAVAELGKLHFDGRIAWLMWMFVHLMSLLGMRNKAVVLINWTWNYFTFSSALRLLLRPAKYPLKSEIPDPEPTPDMAD